MTITYYFFIFKIMKNTKPKDLFIVLKILKNKNISYIDKRIPMLILKLIYDFFWNIFYISKLFAIYRGKMKVGIKDINLACFFFAKKLQEKTIDRFRTHTFGKFDRSFLGNKITKQDTRKTAGKPKIIEFENVKIA